MSDETARITALEARVGVAEQTISALKLRSDDHENDIRAFGPLVTDNVRIFERVDTLHRRVDLTESGQSALRESIAARTVDDQRRDQENKRFRVTTYIAVITVFISLCGVLVAVLTALGGHS